MYITSNSSLFSQLEVQNHLVCCTAIWNVRETRGCTGHRALTVIALHKESTFRYTKLQPSFCLHCANRSLRPDGINFVFPVSRPTLQKRADPKIFIPIFFFFFLRSLPQRCISGTCLQQMFFLVLNTSTETFPILP